MTLDSERVIVQAPMSYAGSTHRIWRLAPSDPVALRIAALVAIITLALPAVWIAVTVWYMTFGLLLVPYRLVRRGDRNRKRQALQHREVMATMHASREDRP